MTDPLQYDRGMVQQMTPAQINQARLDGHLDELLGAKPPIHRNVGRQLSLDEVQQMTPTEINAARLDGLLVDLLAGNR